MSVKREKVATRVTRCLRRLARRCCYTIRGGCSIQRMHRKRKRTASQEKCADGPTTGPTAGRLHRKTEEQLDRVVFAQTNAMWQRHLAQILRRAREAATHTSISLRKRSEAQRCTSRKRVWTASVFDRDDDCTICDFVFFFVSPRVSLSRHVVWVKPVSDAGDCMGHGLPRRLIVCTRAWFRPDVEITMRKTPRKSANFFSCFLFQHPAAPPPIPHSFLPSPPPHFDRHLHGAGLVDASAGRCRRAAAAAAGPCALGRARAGKTLCEIGGESTGLWGTSIKRLAHTLGARAGAPGCLRRRACCRTVAPRAPSSPASAPLVAIRLASISSSKTQSPVVLVLPPPPTHHPRDAPAHLHMRTRTHHFPFPPALPQAAARKVHVRNQVVLADTQRALDAAGALSFVLSLCSVLLSSLSHNFPPQLLSP
jgi:hypothetical protein